MSKKALNYSKNCFRLKGKQQLFIKDEVLVSFAPWPKNKRIKHTSIMPTFNSDRKHYTLAFSLPITEPDSDATLQEVHERKVRQAQTEIEQIYAKPKCQQKYCGVCRGYYEEYVRHTESDIHISNLKTSQYQRLISQLARQYQQKTLSKQDWPAAGESFSEEIFKCLSTQILQDTSFTRKTWNQNYREF